MKAATIDKFGWRSSSIIDRKIYKICVSRSVLICGEVESVRGTIIRIISGSYLSEVGGNSSICCNTPYLIGGAA